MGPTDESRLELDDDGRVVDDVGRPGVGRRTIVDLQDPDSTLALSATRIDAVLGSTVSPWLRRHRGPVSAAAVVVLSLAAAGAWWLNRPPYVPPPTPLSVADAALDGSAVAGPRISADGVLSVAYALHSTDEGTRFHVLGLTGPGIAPLATGAPPTTPAEVTARQSVLVRTDATLSCTDPGVMTGSRSSYGLRVRQVEADGSTSTVAVPFSGDVADLSAAVRNHCLLHYVAPAVSVVTSNLIGNAGSYVPSLELDVSNSSDLPVSVSTVRGRVGDVDVDLSPVVEIPPRGSAVVTTRLIVQNCAGPPRPAPLSTLPHPTRAVGSVPASDVGGLTLRLLSGTHEVLASYPWGTSLADLSVALSKAACRAAPSVSASVTDLHSTRSVDGGWEVAGTYVVETTGIGVSLGSEHFDGPPWGAGSILTSGEPAGTAWALAPAHLDGGAGYLALTFTGSTCVGADREVPSRIPVHVMAADRTVYPFAVPLPVSRLTAAIAAVCPAS